MNLVEAEPPTLSTLRDARDLLAERYSPRSLDADGHVAHHHRNAVRFSLLHAIEKCAPNEAAQKAAVRAVRRAWAALPDRLEWDDFWHWETERGKDAVLALFDAAIAVAP